MAFSQKQWNLIHNIMFQKWDPMGVSEVNEAQNQYDIYIPTLYHLLNSETSLDNIINYLVKIETEYMGLSGNKEHTKNIAHLLVESIKI